MVEPRKNLHINISRSEIDDQDDILEPPSPPAPYLIYCNPESTSYHNYAGNKSWQQGKKDEPKEERIQKCANYIRREIFRIAKNLIKLIFQNNNLLLIANLVNKVWKTRYQFSIPIVHLTRQTLSIWQHNGYKNLLSYIQDQFIKQKSRHPNVIVTTDKSLWATLISIWATTTHLLVVMKKIGLKWTSNTIESMGGLDSIVLAISAIAFTKSLQRSGRIF